MACFLVPAAEAVVTTVATKVMQKKENEVSVEKASGAALDVKTHTLPFSDKMKWLNRMLWGGSALLAFEHLWHGEVIPYFPFLTAAYSAENTAEMLREMSTVGVSMAVLVTGVWAAMVAVSRVIEKRPANMDTVCAAEE